MDSTVGDSVVQKRTSYLAICLRRVDVVRGDLVSRVIRIMNAVESRLVITGREMKDIEGYFVDTLFARSHQATQLT